MFMEPGEMGILLGSLPPGKLEVTLQHETKVPQGLTVK